MSQPSATSGLLMRIRTPKIVITWMLPPPTVTVEELGECKKQGELRHRIAPDS